MSSSASARRGPLAADRPTGEKSAVESMPGAAPRLEGDEDGVAHGELGEQGGRLEAAAEPGPGPGRRRPAARSTSPSSSTVPDDGTKPPMAFISVDLPAPLVPMSPTTSPSPTSIETWSTATLPPKRTTTSVGAQGGHARRERRALLGLSGPGRRGAASAVPGPRRRSTQSRMARAGAVADLDEPAGEVEQEHEQADAGGEQGHEVVVGEEGGQADHPHRAEHGAGHRAQPADHDHRHERAASRPR